MDADPILDWNVARAGAEPVGAWILGERKQLIRRGDNFFGGLLLAIGLQLRG